MRRPPCVFRTQCCGCCHEVRHLELRLLRAAFRGIITSPTRAVRADEGKARHTEKAPHTYAGSDRGHYRHDQQSFRHQFSSTVFRRSCVSRVRANGPGVHSAKQARVVSKAPSFPRRALLLAPVRPPMRACVKTRRPGATTHAAAGRVEGSAPRKRRRTVGRGRRERERDSFERHRSNPCPAPSCSARAARSGEEARSDRV